MSDTVNYSDEDKLLTSDEFIKTAKANADKNLQIQKDTAQKVFDSTYASLERQYDEAATAAGIAKQRNLIDADTAYQRQELKYGAEQETLAAAGLSGSGMNEYRRAQSYQQNREDRQMSYAEYDRALREAAYTRDQGKLAADINKIQDDADADILYNDTMTGISEKELGYADLERQEIDAAYSGYLAGIEDGSLTMDQIKADSSWEKLSDGQKEAVVTASTVKGLKGRIDNGESWEDIQKSYAYLELDEDGRNQVDGYHAQVVAGKTKDANAALGSYLKMANAGWSIDDIVAAAKGNGHYDILNESGAWQSVANAVSSYAKDKAAEETEANFTTAIGLINDGWTLEEVKGYFGGDLAKALGEKNAGQLRQVADVAARIKSETEGKTTQESLLSYLDLAATGKYTLDQLVAIATSLGHYDTLSKLDKDGNETGLWAQVVSKFKEIEEDKTTTETVTNIENAIANGATLEDIQGMEGYDDLDDPTKATIEQAVKDRDERTEASIDYIIAEVNATPDVSSLSALNSFLNSYSDSEGNLLSKDMKEKVVTKWQNDNAYYSIDSINSARFENGKLTIDGVEITGAMLAEEIKNGFYGEHAKSIVTAFVKKIESEIDENDVVSVANALSQISPLYTHGANIAYSNVYKKVRISSGYKEGDKVDSRDTIIGAAITDNDTISALEKVSSDYNDTKLLVRVGSSAYYRKNGKWYEVKILTEKEQTHKDAEEAGKEYAASGKNVIDAMKEEKAKETGIYGKNSSSSTASAQTDENGNKVLVIGKKK